MLCDARADRQTPLFVRPHPNFLLATSHQQVRPTPNPRGTNPWDELSRRNYLNAKHLQSVSRRTHRHTPPPRAPRRCAANPGSPRILPNRPRFPPTLTLKLGVLSEPGLQKALAAKPSLEVRRRI